MTEKFTIEIGDNGICKFGLNINEQNSFDLSDLQLLQKKLELVLKDSKVRVLILHSIRANVFSLGLNLNELAKNSVDSTREFLNLFFGILGLLYNFPTPVISVMRGHAIGYGCMLALASDYRFITEKARIGLPEVKLGIRVPILVSRFLQDILIPAKANQLTLEGFTIKGYESLKIGLVDQIVKEEDQLLFAEKFARKFLQNSSSATALTKKAQRHYIDTDGIIRLDTDLQLIAVNTADAKEGILAASERRRPSFA